MTGIFGGCPNCVGECCRRYVVPVTVADIRTIIAATALRPADFVELREPPMQMPGFRLSPDGPQQHLTLAKKSVALAHSMAPKECAFLMSLPSGSARCGIYPHRPGACRAFPTTLRMGTAAVRPDVACGTGAWNVATMDLAGFRRDLVAQQAAWAESSRIAHRWNRLVDRRQIARTAGDLFRYLVAYASREGVS